LNLITQLYTKAGTFLTGCSLKVIKTKDLFVRKTKKMNDIQDKNKEPFIIKNCEIL